MLISISNKYFDRLKLIKTIFYSGEVKLRSESSYEYLNNRLAGSLSLIMSAKLMTVNQAIIPLYRGSHFHYNVHNCKLYFSS